METPPRRTACPEPADEAGAGQPGGREPAGRCGRFSCRIKIISVRKVTIYKKYFYICKRIEQPFKTSTI